jgi:hypothetical protein
MRKIRIRKRFVLIPVAALGAVVLVLLLWKHPSTDTPANRDAIYTAIFQKMMARRQRPYTGLSVGDDPDAVVMNSFRNNKGVIPGSRIKMGVIKDLSGFMVPGTRQFAEEFAIFRSTLRWYGPGIVSVDVLAHGSPMDGSLGTYTLVFAGGHWSVINYRDSGLQF